VLIDNTKAQSLFFKVDNIFATRCDTQSKKIWCLQQA